MHDFRYVPKSKYKPLKKQIIELLTEVQGEVRDYFTFQFVFIGSTKRNMITQDMKSPIGFDFDVNIEVNIDDKKYTATDIRNILRPIITRVSWKYGFNKYEDSTRVITIKMTNPWRSTIEHSCDFAVVYGKQYIRFNKKTQQYYWAQQSKDYPNLERKADILKDNNYWDEVIDIYIDKKNFNTDPDKHSRSIYAETINEVYKRYLNAKTK